MALGRGQRQTRRERVQLRRRLHDLELLLDVRLADLGALAAEMHRRNRIDVETLWAQAGDVATIEDEVALIRRGIDERLTSDQLAELAGTS